MIDKQRINPADVAYLDLEDVANIINNFENPEIPDVKKESRWSEEDISRARKEAEKEYHRNYLRNLTRVAIFGFGLQLLWNLGAYLPYLFIGQDDEEKKRMTDDAMNHAMFGSVEGLTAGDAISGALNQLSKGEFSMPGVAKDMPATADLEAIYEKMGKDRVSALNDVINLMVQSGLGVNPQTLTDAVIGIMDACGNDVQTQREAALMIARILNCPPSQLDKIYFDEIDATGREASELTPAEIAERYAQYKIRRNAPMTGWMYTPEDRDSLTEKYTKPILKRAKESFVQTTDEQGGGVMFKERMAEYEQTKKRDHS